MQPSSNDDLRLFLCESFEMFPFFNEMNRSIGNVILSFFGSLTTYLRNLGKNLKDFVMSSCVAS